MVVAAGHRVRDTAHDEAAGLAASHNADAWWRDECKRIAKVGYGAGGAQTAAGGDAR